MAAPDLRNLVPAAYLREDPEGTFSAILDAYQAIFDGYDADLLRLANLLDVERMEAEFVDALLKTFGNPFPLATLTLNQRRALAYALVSMYKLKGTAVGISTACAFFGFSVLVYEHWLHCWEIGVSEIGWDNWLAPDDETEWPNAFYVVLSVSVSAEELDLLRRVVRYMAPPESTFFICQAAPWDDGVGWDDGWTFWDFSILWSSEP